MGRVVIIGSGASYGALGKIAPVCPAFGRSLRKGWEVDYPFLCALVSRLAHGLPRTNLNKWGLDRVWGYLDTAHKLYPIIDWPFALETRPPTGSQKCMYARWHKITDKDERVNYSWDLAGRELRCLLAEVFGDRVSEVLPGANFSGTRLFEVFQDLKPGDTVVSFNYDVVVEHVLFQCKRVYQPVLPGADRGSAPRAIWLCKPHGSLTWRRTAATSTRARDDSVFWQEKPVSSAEIDLLSNGATLEPAVLAPVPFKSEVLDWERQLKDSPKLAALIQAQWDWLRHRLADMDELRIVGYSFPPEDSHVGHVLRSGLQDLTRSWTLRVWDLQSKAGGVIQQVLDYAGGSRPNNVVYEGRIEKAGNLPE